MVQDGFNTTMIWDKFISDVEHQSGQLFTGIQEKMQWTFKGLDEFVQKRKAWMKKWRFVLEKKEMSSIYQI